MSCLLRCNVPDLHHGVCLITYHVFGTQVGTLNTIGLAALRTSEVGLRARALQVLLAGWKLPNLQLMAGNQQDVIWMEIVRSCLWTCCRHWAARALMCAA